MGELLFAVVMTQFAPIIGVALVVCAVIFFYALFKKKRPDFTQVGKALISTLLLELQFLILAIFIFVIFSPNLTYVGPILIMVSTAIVGVWGFLYFVIRDIPVWCQWGTWWRLLWPPSIGN